MSEARRFERPVFFGTPDFAVPTLEALVAAGRAPALVVSQPSRPVGRKQQVVDPPVVRAARRHGLDVVQPSKVRETGFLDQLRDLEPEVAVVVAFGQIFRKSLLELPQHGCINLHASLLPAYRGAAPIQAAMAAGERVTGVTSMVMEKGLDTGPMLLTEELAIGPRETAAELSARLAFRGAALMIETLQGLESGELKAVAQPQDGVSYAPRITKEDGVVDWSLPAARIYDRLRAYTPWPGLSTGFRGEMIKLRTGRALAGVARGSEAPGTLLGLEDGALAVRCGEGVFGIETLQRPGKKALSAGDFVNGLRPEPGERLGG